jgi:CubicO group peptidase (beta-lactamase class C family)
MRLPQTTLRRDDLVQGDPDPAALRALDDILVEAIRDSAFPGAQAVIVSRGAIVYARSFGTYTYDRASREVTSPTMFDLASLTKVIATTPAVMKLVDEGRLRLDDSVGSYLPAFREGEKSSITLRHLLLHRSGFPPFRRFFQFCKNAEEMLDSVFATPLIARPGDSTVYSDLGMITLGKVVEAVTQETLSEFVRREFYEPLGMRSTMFAPPPALLSRIAPTEIDTLWRKALVHGSVHDENAALLGGVSGHAGLFSTAADLAAFVQMLLNGGVYGGRRLLSAEVVRQFTRDHAEGQERCLGWDRKSPTGSSAGELFSETSFGHTGFTGTSIWIDPDRELGVVLLTNRVHPTRANSKLFRVRPAFHDAVVRALNPDKENGLR